MPKVTFSNARGILQEAGTGFQVNDAPILEESETVSGNATIVITPVVVDDDEDDTVLDIAGSYFIIATSDEEFYVWFDGGDGDAEDPTPAGLSAANSIRISDTTGDGNTLVTRELVCKAIADRINASDDFSGDGITDYSGTAADGDVTVVTAVLGPADSDANGAADTANLGADDVSDRLVAAVSGGAGEEIVTITVLPMGSVSSAGHVVNNGSLCRLGEDEDLEWTVELTDALGANGSALQSFGTSIVRNGGAQAATCSLANATAGTKKLIRQDTEDGGGSIVVSFKDKAGAAATATFADDEDLLYLISTGHGWGVLVNPSDNVVIA